MKSRKYETYAEITARLCKDISGSGLYDGFDYAKIDHFWNMNFSFVSSKLATLMDGYDKSELSKTEKLYLVYILVLRALNEKLAVMKRASNFKESNACKWKNTRMTLEIASECRNATNAELSDLVCYMVNFLRNLDSSSTAKADIIASAKHLEGTPYVSDISLDICLERERLSARNLSSYSPWDSLLMVKPDEDIFKNNVRDAVNACLTKQNDLKRFVLNNANTAMNEIKSYFPETFNCLWRFLAGYPLPDWMGRKYDECFIRWRDEVISEYTPFQQKCLKLGGTGVWLGLKKEQVGGFPARIVDFQYDSAAASRMSTQLITMEFADGTEYQSTYGAFANGKISHPAIRCKKQIEYNGMDIRSRKVNDSYIYFVHFKDESEEVRMLSEKDYVSLLIERSGTRNA